jgi:DNA-binding GntR family transcriptional regulator
MPQQSGPLDVQTHRLNAWPLARIFTTPRSVLYPIPNLTPLDSPKIPLYDPFCIPIADFGRRGSRDAPGATVALLPLSRQNLDPNPLLHAEQERLDGEPLSQVATRYLREAILEGRLRAGVRIRQEAIARELGTSRIPVREALRQLENEGLVNLVPRSGARVAKLDFEESAELYRIREELEPLAIAQSAPLLSDDQIDQLRGLMLQIERSRDPAVWLVLDRRFHLASYAAAPMPRLLKMIETFWNTTQQYRRIYYGMIANQRLAADELPMTHVDHRLLFDALERRDPVDAECLLRAHIRRTRVTLANHQELFEQ